MNAQGSAVLMQFVWQAPLLLTYVVVMVVAAVKWSEYPKPSLLVLVSMGLLLALSVGYPILQAVIIAQQAALGLHAGQLGTTLGALGMVLSIFRIVALILLIMAVYTGRTPTPQPWPEE